MNVILLLEVTHVAYKFDFPNHLIEFQSKLVKDKHFLPLKIAVWGIASLSLNFNFL